MMLVVINSIVVLFLLYVVYGRWRRRLVWRRSLPPGSLGLPFIGETIQFISSSYSPRPEAFMEKRRLRYGKVFKSHLFGSPTIVTVDAEISKIVLQSDPSSFVPSYPKSLTELMGESSILLITGNLQKKIHGLIGSFFKSAYLKTQFTDDMETHVHALMDRWNDGDRILVQDEAKQITFRVLVRGLIGMEPGEEMQYLMKQFQQFIAGLISLPVKIPGSRLHRSLQAKKRMTNIVKRIINDRRSQSKKKNGPSPATSTQPRDVIDVLINDGTQKLTDDLISDNMIDLIIPGEDSVPTLITLLVKYLSESPAALRQIEVINQSINYEVNPNDCD